MTKKKANLCTVLLAIVLFAVWTGSWFLVIDDGVSVYRLHYTISGWMAFWFICNCLHRFRNWLMK